MKKCEEREMEEGEKKLPLLNHPELESSPCYDSPCDGLGQT